MLVVFILPTLTVIIKIYHNEQKTISMHDLTNNFLSLGISTQYVKEPNVIREHINRVSKQFNIDLSQIDDDKLKKNIENRDKMTYAVKEFIYVKNKQKGKNIKIFEDIRCSKEYKHVDLTLMLTWLGTLLDNAIEASNVNPIFINIRMNYNNLNLFISNEYIGNKEKDIERILEHGYSTKGEGRGIGLHLLNTQVKEKGGKIILDEYYSPEHNCYYLQISIIFDDYNPSLTLK